MFVCPSHVEWNQRRWAIVRPADSLVVVVHLFEAEPARGGGATVELVERALSEQLDQFDALERARSPVEVVVGESSPRELERGVHASDLVPQGSRHEEAVALALHAEDASTGRARESADAEEPVSVRRPARCAEELVFHGLVVADLGGLHVRFRAEMERRRRDHRTWGECLCAEGSAHESGRRQPSAVDEQTDELPLGCGDAVVRRCHR